MAVLIGIDVGGTFSDGVVFRNGVIDRWVKVPTDSERLKETILSVLDQLMDGLKSEEVKRLVLSTTLVTNLLATGRLDKVGLILIPGPGIHPRDLNLVEGARVIRGGIDFRGREIEKLDPAEIKAAGDEIFRQGIRKVAVVGKFSQRNPIHEDTVVSILQKAYPEWELLAGHMVSQRLNFPRRAVTTYYTLATRNQWSRFTEQIEEALQIRGFKAPVDIMKADGGTMSLMASKEEPCQTVFSGPAASTMGAFALTMDDLTSVVVDIGGTTTDLAFILGGRPLYASKGARIEGRFTQVSALAVRSMALGGDSVVRLKEGKLVIGPERLGVAACFGGPAPTPTDAFNIIGGGSLGNPQLSLEAFCRLSPEGENGARQLAAEVVDTFIRLLQASVQDMQRSWEDEPAYKVWEIVHRRKVTVDRVIGIGAASPAFVPILAKRMQTRGFVNQYSGIANALGAAVARPTLQLVLHADTQAGIYSAGGVTSRLENPNRFQMKDARQLAEQELEKMAERRGVIRYYKEREFFLEEQFNVIRGWSTTGRIFDVGVGISPGVIEEFKGVR